MIYYILLYIVILFILYNYNIDSFKLLNFPHVFYKFQIIANKYIVIYNK